MHHDYFMRRAIALALKVPEFPFGAVIVRRETAEVVAEGFNQSDFSWRDGGNEPLCRIAPSSRLERI